MLALQTCTIHIQKCINKKNYEIYLMSFKNKDVRTAIKLLGGNRFILLIDFALIISSASFSGIKCGDVVKAVEVVADIVNLVIVAEYPKTILSKLTTNIVIFKMTG